MYEDASQQLDVILDLVKKCPESLQERCFGILLQGYVDSAQARAIPGPSLGGPVPEPEPTEGSVPGEVRGRLRALAKRLAVEEGQLEELFDFTADPFVYHPIEAPGATNADKTRNVALLVAVRTYLASGNWTADWAEVKARCVDLNCYDGPNHASFLKRGRGSLFKSVEVGKAIELSGPGRTAAEQALKGLVVSA